MIKFVRRLIVANRFKKSMRKSLRDVRTAHLDAVSTLDPLTGERLDHEWTWDDVREPQNGRADLAPVIIPTGKKKRPVMHGHDSKAGPWGA